MTDYPYDQIFAADPSNPANVASGGVVVLFAPGDSTKTPIPLKTLDGMPLANPVAVNKSGFGPAYIAQLWQVAWEGGGFSGVFTSNVGLRDEATAAVGAAQIAQAAAEAAQSAAENAAPDAAAAATAAAASTIAASASDAQTAKDAAEAAAALVGAPADFAVAAAISGTGATKTAFTDAVRNTTPGAARNKLTGWYHADGSGADLSGVADSRAAVQAAVNAAVADIIATGTGRTVYLPAGILAFKTSSPITPSTHNGAKIGVSLPVNLPAVLTIKGAGKKSTVIQLSDNARGAFWIDKKTDYDIVQNIVFEDFEIDNNGSVGRGQILFGSMPEWITPQTRLSFKNIRVSRVDCYNVPVDTTQTVTVKGFVILQGAHLTHHEATQTFTKDVLIEDCVMRDVQNGLQVYTSVSLGAQNHYYDNITFRNCHHYAAATMPTKDLSTTSFYIAGAGFGDTFTIRDCSSKYVGDDSIEIGAMQTGLIDNFKSYNAILVHILFRLTHALTNPAAQRIVISNCDLNVGADFFPAAIPGAGSRAINWITDTGTGADPNLNFGTFIIENVSHNVDGGVHSKISRPQNQLGFEARGPVRRIEYKSCRVAYRNYNYDETYRLYFSFFRANMAPVSLGNGTTNVGVAVFQNCESVMEGTTGPNGGDMQISGITAGGDKGRVEVNGYRMNILNCPSGISGLYMAMLGEAGNGSPNLVKLTNLSGYWYNSIQQSRRGVKVMPDSVFTKAIVSDSDFRNWGNGAAGTDVDETAAGTNAGKTTSYNNLASP